MSATPTPPKARRFTSYYTKPDMFEDADGNYVLFSDYERIDCALRDHEKNQADLAACVRAGANAVRENAQYIQALEAEVQKLRELLHDAENALSNSYDVCEWPGKDSFQYQIMLKLSAALNSNAGEKGAG